ncbi:MAG TPA: DegT/DnrJ/EryC1/StrS family aminotransferase [Desulfobaccales bacterium]
MNVPFVDLRAQHEEVRAEIEVAFKGVVDRSSFVGGELVNNFEKNFASFCGARYAVSCASGTDALKLALMAAGVSRGDEVITVPNTFIATAEAISLVGAQVIFVDIDRETYNMSPQRLEEFLKSQCRPGADGKFINIKTGRPVTAVLPVHLYGLAADIKPILELAENYNLRVIEDACQSHGAAYSLNGVEKMAGTFGAAGAFSFYPGKNLGAMGEGGAVTTNDESMNRKMRMWRDHGQQEKYLHLSPDGWNGRLDALQGAILDVKLKKLAEWNEGRRRAAAWYRERLAGDPRIILPQEPSGRKHVYHLFVVRLADRERARQHLASQGIGVGLHYPIPLHLQEAYRDLGGKPGDFSESEAAASSILSLPMYPHLTEEQVDYICRCLKSLLG